MKKLTYYLFFVIFLLVSCSGNEENIKVYGYELGNMQLQDFKLNIVHLDNEVYFEYLHETDSIKNIRLKYKPQEDFIIIGLDTFNLQQNSYKVQQELYNLYQEEKTKSHQRTLVFNRKFGLLASLVYGKDIVFLTDSISSAEKEFIFKDLFININNTEIQ